MHILIYDVSTESNKTFFFSCATLTETYQVSVDLEYTWKYLAHIYFSEFTFSWVILAYYKCFLKMEDKINFCIKLLNNATVSFNTGLSKSISISDTWGSPSGVMVKVLDCSLKVSEFKLQLHYYIHFLTNTLGKMYEPPYPPSYC